ncbi:hypothetical protein [Tabrizicola sp.]|uniref:hypothetical protein n=1 Tax=Tabrizicola sp. TaxID=2005166 RepID=UPI00286AE77E|nr:hypothetical protein [Tabrizicola sp.]
MRQSKLVSLPLFAFAILIALSPQALRADGKFDAWTLIHAGKMAEVRQLLASPDLAAQRMAFAAFRTSDPVVAAFSEAMLAETPDDPKAMTARGMSLHSTGWKMRGTSEWSAIYPQARERMLAMHTEAEALALAALSADPTLIPASDLWMRVSMTLGHNSIVPDEIQRVMAIAPTRQSLTIAASALAPQWGGSEEYGYALCDEWAAIVTDVKDYTVEICKLDVVFAANYSWQTREAVREQVVVVDHPVLAGPRLDLAISGRVPKAVAVTILRVLQSSEEMKLHHFRRWDDLEGKSDISGVGPRTKAALGTLIPRMRAESDFDPGDGIALMLYIDALLMQRQADGSEYPRDEVEARFGALFDVAPYDPDAWSRFGFYLDMFRDASTMTLADADHIRAAFVNSVVYANHKPSYVRTLASFNRMFWEGLDKRNLDAMDATGEPAFDREEFNTRIVCPTVRSIRVLDALCKGGLTQPEGCPEDVSMSDDSWPRLTELKERAKSRKACETELSADPQDLLYSLVPMDLHKMPGTAD